MVHVEWMCFLAILWKLHLLVHLSASFGAQGCELPSFSAKSYRRQSWRISQLVGSQEIEAINAPRLVAKEGMEWIRNICYCTRHNVLFCGFLEVSKVLIFYALQQSRPLVHFLFCLQRLKISVVPSLHGPERMYLLWAKHLGIWSNKWLKLKHPSCVSDRRGMTQSQKHCFGWCRFISCFQVVYEILRIRRNIAVNPLDWRMQNLLSGPQDETLVERGTRDWLVFTHFGQSLRA